MRLAELPVRTVNNRLEDEYEENATEEKPKKQYYYPERVKKWKENNIERVREHNRRHAQKVRDKKRKEKQA